MEKFGIRYSIHQRIPSHDVYANHLKRTASGFIYHINKLNEHCIKFNSDVHKNQNILIYNTFCIWTYKKKKQEEKKQNFQIYQHQNDLYFLLRCKKEGGCKSDQTFIFMKFDQISRSCSKHDWILIPLWGAYTCVGRLYPKSNRKCFQVYNFTSSPLK